MKAASPTRWCSTNKTKPNNHLSSHLTQWKHLFETYRSISAVEVDQRRTFLWVVRDQVCRIIFGVGRQSSLCMLCHRVRRIFRTEICVLVRVAHTYRYSTRTGTFVHSTFELLNNYRTSSSLAITEHLIMILQACALADELKYLGLTLRIHTRCQRLIYFWSPRCCWTLFLH